MSDDEITDGPSIESCVSLSKIEKNVPNHLMMASLLEHICSLYAIDKDQHRKLFKGTNTLILEHHIDFGLWVCPTGSLVIALGCLSVCCSVVCSWYISGLSFGYLGDFSLVLTETMHEDRGQVRKVTGLEFRKDLGD